MGPQGEDIDITIIYLTLGFLLFAVFLIFFIAIYRVRLNRHVKERMQMKVKFDHAILQTQLEIQEQTLKNISQEIHDNIGQVLSLAKLNLNSFPPISDQAVQTRVDDTKHLVAKALRDLRDLSRSMHGDKIAEIGLKAAITAELKLLQNTGNFTTDLLVNGAEYTQDTQTEMVLFRMVQESLNNTVKHSKAKNIKVQMDYDPDTFVLSVTDDGVGFDPATLSPAETGIGLKNMQNRAALIGAIFTLNAARNEGTQVTITLARHRQNA